MSHDVNDQIEATADRIRDDFLETLRELDRRRARATDFRFQVQQHAEGLWALALAAGALAAGAVAIAVYRRKSRGKRDLQHRVRALQRAWKHPERLATKAKDRPLHMELGRKLVLAGAAAAVAEASKRAAQRLVARTDDTLH